MKYKNKVHLGLKNAEEYRDLRVCRDDLGSNVYLFDWSGSWPDLTDDGELILDRARMAKVSETFVRIPVRKPHEGASEYWCACEMRNFHRLMEAIPDLRVAIKDRQLSARGIAVLVEAAKLLEADESGMDEFYINVDTLREARAAR